MIHRRDLLRSAPLLLTLPSLARAQSGAAAFPAKPVTMIVPFSAGQSGDILARALSDALGKVWDKPMIIDNRGGAGGALGSVMAARARPDGYTLLLGSSGPTTIAPSLYKNVGYDPNKDFTPIINVAGVPQVLLVPAGSKYKTMQDFINDAKARPGKLSYGSGGKGSTAHLTMELFKSQAGIEIEHVPYKGAALAYPDLIAGRLDAMFDTTPAAINFINSNQIRPLGVSTKARSPSLPNVPTIAEAGLQGFELLAWWGIVAPAGLPTALQQQLNRDFARVLAMDDVKQRLESMGMMLLGGSAQTFGTFIRSEYEKFAAVIKANHISTD